MLIKLFMINGSEVVFVINLLVMIKGKINFLLKCNVLIIVNIIGVNIRVVLLFVNNVVMIVFNIDI